MDLGYGRMDPNISLPMDLHRSNPALNRGKYATGGLFYPSVQLLLQAHICRPYIHTYIHVSVDGSYE
ncbi:hypothetical protein DPMN_155244 [Dreissena polymorpha]|uniref:Uncharacterized protein n=1 Tax=Dreissena polymorpha TaxID=45954 RepID=A0A9D4J9U2_DREPO|nr:hypothetical protein DPMN_155187 [Dreissena polymorpha]KAH3801589.1 hypothetical protein DPMN_155244 [Dreissena polymorpha]